MAGITACALPAFASEVYDFTRQPVHLSDVSKHNGSWTFDVGKLKVGETTRVVAKDTVSLVVGATGPLDLGNLAAVNVVGNWSASPVALDLLKLETVPTTPDMDQARAGHRLAGRAYHADWFTASRIT